MANAVQGFLPANEVKKLSSQGASGNLKAALQFFEIMKNHLLQDYADPDPEASMTVFGTTLKGQERYGTLGNFLLGQWFTDYTNLIENLSSAVAFETKLYQDAGKLLGA